MIKVDKSQARKLLKQGIRLKRTKHHWYMVDTAYAEFPYGNSDCQMYRQKGFRDELRRVT